jgi:repressor LexA
MAKLNRLTAAQKRVYDWIIEYINRMNMSPTLAEIADGLGYRHVSSMIVHINALAKKGFIRRHPNIARGIEVIRRHPTAIPVYGYVPAGVPFLSDENIVDNFELRRYISAPSNVFGLYVRGDSMRDAALYEGDLLFVDPTKEPQNGEIIVALVNGDPTVKRYYRENGTITLKPENSKYTPIVVHAQSEQFRCIGTVIGLIRRIDKRRIDQITTV